MRLPDTLVELLAQLRPALAPSYEVAGADAGATWQLSASELCMPSGCSSSDCLTALILFPNETNVRRAIARCRRLMHTALGLPRANLSFFLYGRPGGGKLKRWIQRSCEPGLHDQSGMNWLFEGAWRPLSQAYNVQVQLWEKMACSVWLNRTLASAAVLHYAGEAKPWWEKPERVATGVSPLSRRVTRVWRTLCPSVPRERGSKGAHVVPTCDERQGLVRSLEQRVRVLWSRGRVR